MLVQSLFSVCLLMLTLCFLTSFLGTYSIRLYDLADCIEQETHFDQLRMIFESDLFIRRRSPISTATNERNKFCIGFWEDTNEGLKYIIYDFQLQNNSTRVGRFTRSCFNQEDLKADDSSIYCHRLIANITNGIYSTQNQTKYLKNYSDFCSGDVSFGNELTFVRLGDYHYVFE